MTSASARYRDVLSRMARACEAAQRDPADVTLIAVSKTVAVDAIRELYDLGHRDFGESRLQEAIPKMEALPSDIRWHGIGALQSNKARRAAERFDALHTIDNEGQLREIEKATRVDGSPTPVLVEVNIASEPQKRGILPQNLDGFLRLVLQYKQVHLRGLMTIGPADLDSEGTRRIFRHLRELRDRSGTQWLSMGMSGDFEVAIQEGSTHVRVGSALFGARD